MVRNAGGVLVGAAILALVACGDNRGGDVPALRAALERQPGVRVLDAVGHDEMWPFFGPENIRATLSVGEEGVLILCGLELDDLEAPGAFRIARVGHSVPEIRIEGDTTLHRVSGCPNAVDAGPEAPLLDLLPSAPLSPIDAVRRYRELDALFASWPEKPARARTRDGQRWISYWKSPASNVAGSGTP